MVQKAGFTRSSLPSRFSRATPARLLRRDSGTGVRFLPGFGGNLSLDRRDDEVAEQVQLVEEFRRRTPLSMGNVIFSNPLSFGGAAGGDEGDGFHRVAFEDSAVLRAQPQASPPTVRWQRFRRVAADR